MPETTLQFFVPGKPIGKARPQHNRITGNTFTPKKTKDYEKHVRECFEANYPLFEPVSGPVHVKIYAIVLRSNDDIVDLVKITKK